MNVMPSLLCCLYVLSTQRSTSEEGGRHPSKLVKEGKENLLLSEVEEGGEREEVDYHFYCWPQFSLFSEEVVQWRNPKMNNAHLK